MGKTKASNREGSFDYLGVAKGQFTKRLDPANLGFDPELSIPEGFRKRTYTDQASGEEKIIYEEIFESISGFIEKMEITTPPFGGQQFAITLNDGEEVNTIQMALVTGYGLGSYAKGFIQRIPYIELRSDVKLLPYDIPREDDPKKSNVGIAVYQKDGDDWKKKPTAFTKANPEGVPEPKLTEGMGGIKKWDFTDHNNFLYKKLTDFIDEFNAAQVPSEPETPEGEDTPF